MSVTITQFGADTPDTTPSVNTLSPSLISVSALSSSEIDLFFTSNSGVARVLTLLGQFNLASLSSHNTLADLMNVPSLGTVSTDDFYTNGVLQSTEQYNSGVSFSDFVSEVGFNGATAKGAALNSILSGNDTYVTTNTLIPSSVNVDLYGGNNTFYENHPMLQYDDTFYGGSNVGINTAVLPGNFANYSISQSSVYDVYTKLSDFSGYRIVDNTGATNSLGIYQVERLQFADTKLALDVGNGGHAGEAAEILGAVFGVSSIQTHPDYVGIGLNALDSGMGVSELSTLALQAAGATTNLQVVNLLYTNILGVAPTAAQAAPFVNLLTNGMTVGTLAVLAEGSTYNDTNINLIGLQHTGIHYT